jgi:hypothetical protein
MRILTLRVATLAASIALAACSAGTVIVVRQPTPPPAPPPPRIEPLEITVARPVRGQLIVQTNRPSYVAIFEIVPDRGVALLAPANAYQRSWMLVGLNWVPVSWKLQSAMYYGPPSGRAIPARWVYAIASDEPLRLPDEAFHPAYLRRVLGPAAYRGTNPYLTMRAIARAFVPSVVDEAWAEDAYALAATYVSDPYRTVRIYCANRAMYEVPEELADRAWCPVRVASGVTIVRSTPTRPDSVVASSGPRIRRRPPETMPVRTPIDRVREPSPPEHAPIANDNNAPRNDTNKDAKDAKDVAKEVKDAKERRGNGNAYGHTDDPSVKGRGIENEKRNDPRRVPRADPPPVIAEPEAKPEKVEAKQEKQDEKQLRREEKQEEKAEKLESKADKPAVSVEPPREPDMPMVKPDVKPEAKPEKKEEDRAAKLDEKPETKADVKTETQEEKAEAKSEDKSEGKAEAKPHDKPHDKSDAESPGKKDRKGKP